MSVPTQANTDVSTADAVGTDELSELLVGNLEATVGEQGTEDFYELYVLPDPDPDSAIHLVMLLSTAGELFHIGTFDTDELQTEAHTAMLDR